MENCITIFVAGCFAVKPEIRAITIRTSPAVSQQNMVSYDNQLDSNIESERISVRDGKCKRIIISSSVFKNANLI